MKIVKIIALVLTGLGLLIAAYGATQLSDYRTADKAWQRSSDAYHDLLRGARNPDGSVEPGMQSTLKSASDTSNRLGDVRNDMRSRCQKIVQASILPIGLGLILGIIGLTRRPRGWMPLTTTLGALLGGGLIGSMLAAGVF